MDTVTQAVLGAAVAEAGFRGRLGGKAVVFGALCGLAPDADVLTSALGEWEGLLYHRSYSHSLLVLPFVALPLGWLGSRFWGQKQHLAHWIHLAFWALITHPLLDVFTAYGTQLFAPLSSHRYAFDSVAIIDPIYTVPLLLCTYFAWRRPGLRSQRFAAIALVFTTLYLGLGTWVSQRQIDRAQVALHAEGFVPEHVRAMPPILFPWLRRIAAREPGGRIAVGNVSVFSAAKPRWNLQIRPNHALLTKALETREGKIFRWFSDDLWVAEIRSTQTSTVVLSDQRYGLFLQPTRSIFTAHAQFDGQGRLRRWQRPRTPRTDGLAAEIAEAWRLSWAR